MSEFLAGVLGLFDSTMKAMFDVPIFAFFLVFLLFLLVVSLYLLFVSMAGGKHLRR